MRDIPGYEGHYAATSCGKIWSHKRQRFLKPEIVHNGYERVCLCKDSECRKWRVHTLVALTYLDNPNNYTEINHKDENKRNNCIQNLEWCSHQQNINYYWEVRKKIWH